MSLPLPQTLKMALQPTRQWLAVSLAPERQAVTVRLVTAGASVDVTANVGVAALRPFMLRMSLEDADVVAALKGSPLHRNAGHFAYPFGDRDSFRRAHVVMAEEAGFSSAVSAIAGIVEAEGRTNLRALPRIAWDGRMRSLRAMRVILSGAAFDPVMPTPSKPDF